MRALQDWTEKKREKEEIAFLTWRKNSLPSPPLSLSLLQRWEEKKIWDDAAISQYSNFSAVPFFRPRERGRPKFRNLRYSSAQEDCCSVSRMWGLGCQRECILMTSDIIVFCSLSQELPFAQEKCVNSLGIWRTLLYYVHKYVQMKHTKSLETKDCTWISCVRSELVN